MIWCIPLAAICSETRFPTESKPPMPAAIWSRLRNRFTPGDAAPASLAIAREAIRQGRSEPALEALRQATAAAPTSADAWALLGWVHNDLGNAHQADAALARAIALDPGHLEALNTLGVIASESADPGAAINFFERALALDPDNPATRYNLAQRLFFAGDYGRGFAMMRARHAAHYGRDNPLEPLPAWQGEALDGRHVFVWCDWGGLGDHLQFARYVLLLRQRARPARLTLGCSHACLRLFSAGLPGVDEVLLPGTVPSSDVHVPLLDLPYFLATGAATVPAPVPYLAADATYTSNWRARLASASADFETSALKVGLVWATGKWNQGAGYDRVRVAKSIPAHLLVKLDARDVSFVSLQKDGGEAPTLPMIDLSAAVTDLADTAAIIANLDLVISADTAVAHLAGAMGKPVILLLRREGGMFWSLGEERSPWYPDMTIVRQRSSGDWLPVLATAAQLIEARKSGGPGTMPDGDCG